MRTTKTITLPISKSKIVINDYITGGEKRKINDLLLKNSSVETGSTVIKGDIPLLLIYEANDLALSFLVKSIDDISDDLINRINDLHTNDYDYLKAEIDSVTNDKSFLE